MFRGFLVQSAVCMIYVFSRLMLLLLFYQLLLFYLVQYSLSFNFATFFTLFLPTLPRFHCLSVQ